MSSTTLSQHCSCVDSISIAHVLLAQVHAVVWNQVSAAVGSGGLA